MAGPLVRRAWRGTAAVVSAMTWGIESPAASSRAGVEPSGRRTGGQEAGSRERGILGDSCDYAWITGNSEVICRRTVISPGRSAYRPCGSVPGTWPITPFMADNLRSLLCCFLQIEPWTDRETSTGRLSFVH